MRVLYERCCGLDVHKKSVVACVLTPEAQEVKTFGTTTRSLLTLADWLRERRVTHVAMESTGVYWKPVYNLLEDEFTVWVVNAEHVKALPGRKTDVKDAEWLADLLRHGLLRPSFIPDRPQRELRELVRYRRGMIQERSRVVNRMHKVLEGANIKLASVASNVVGASGRAMVAAIVDGMGDPKTLAELARGRLREKLAELEDALHGLIGPHQRLLLGSLLRHLAFLEEEITRLDAEVEQRMGPFEEALTILDTIPGVGRRTAEAIVAEAGIDMGRFPTAGHLASWAGVCPGNHRSGGKRKPTSRLRGNVWLQSALVEAARAAAPTKTYLGAQYHRLASRRGSSRAIMAVAHSIAVIAYALLKHMIPYSDLGDNYFDQRDQQATIRRTVHRLEQLGFQVKLEAA